MSQEYVTGKAAWTNVKLEKIRKYYVSNKAKHLHSLWTYVAITTFILN